MTSRRALLTGVLVAGGVVALGVTETLDDAVRAVGVHPRPQPRSADVTLLRAVLQDQQRLLALARGTADAEQAAEVLAEQVRQLGATPTTTASSAGELGAELRLAADHRATDAASAIAADVVMVLAAMSAGLSQLAATYPRSGA